jgi:hypothetical protein
VSKANRKNDRLIFTHQVADVYRVLLAKDTVWSAVRAIYAQSDYRLGWRSLATVGEGLGKAFDYLPGIGRPIGNIFADGWVKEKQNENLITQAAGILLSWHAALLD